MRWFFVAFGTVTAILFLSFVAWIATRVMHLDSANYYVGKIMIYDLYGVAVILAYSAFVGGFHLWEKLTGRMEAERTESVAAEANPGAQRAPGSSDRGTE